jgi:ADP-heptose:LPS heptosyltransferase
MKQLKIRDRRRNAIMALIDTVVALLFLIAGFFREKHVENLGKANISKMLLLRTDNIGDVILLTPVIRTLREAFPSACIDVLIRPVTKDVLVNNPDVSNIVTCRVPWFMNKILLKDLILLIKDVIKIRRESYDLIIDFRGDFRNIFFYLYLGGGRCRLSFDRSGGVYLLTHVVDFNEDIHAIDKNFSLLEPLGVTLTDRSMRMYVAENDRIALRNKLSDLDAKGHYLVGIHPGASSMTRRWPVERFAEVVNELSLKLPCKFYVSGDNSERELGATLGRYTDNKTYDLTGKLTISELAALLEKTDLFICNETGVMHLSVALKTDTISIYGPQLPEKYGHINEHSRILWKRFDCCPCLHHYTCKKTNTPMALCLNAISADEVVQCALEVLEEKGISL